MKKLLLTSLAVLSLIACEEDTVIYNGDDYVSFNSISEEISTTEDAETYDLVIGMSETQDQDVTVELNVTSDTAVEGVNFTIPSSVTIPAGETFSPATITLIDDTEINTTRSFSVEIVSVSMSGLNIGISDIGSYAKTIKIINDDCPTKFSYWIGDISVEDVGYGSTAGTGTVNEDGDCDLLIVDNDLPGAGSGADNTIYELQFYATNAEGTTGIVIVEATLTAYAFDTTASYDAYYEAAGTFDTETGEIILDYELQGYSVATGEYAGNFWTGTTIITIP